MSNTDAPWPWSELGLNQCPDTERDVQRAYAARLKTIDSEENPQAFEALRSAYEVGRNIAKNASSGGRSPSSRSGGRSIVAELRQQAPAPQRASPPVLRPEPTAPEYEPQPEPEASFPEPAAKPEDTQPEPPKSTNPWADPDLSNPQVVISKAHSLVEKDSLRLSNWAPLLGAPALSDPQTARQLQWIMVDFMSQRIAACDMSMAKHTELFAAIDKRFGWVSDGIGFLRQFPQARILQQAMATVLRDINRRDNVKSFSSPRPSPAPTAKSIPALIWVLPFVAWLFLLAS